jgi:hypothetical protein
MRSSSSGDSFTPARREPLFVSSRFHGIACSAHGLADALETRRFGLCLVDPIDVLESRGIGELVEVDFSIGVLVESGLEIPRDVDAIPRTVGGIPPAILLCLVDPLEAGGCHPPALNEPLGAVRVCLRQVLLGFRGENLKIYVPSSTPFIWLSIHPKHSASSTASSYDTPCPLDPFFRTRIHAIALSEWFDSSHARHSLLSLN